MESAEFTEKSTSMIVSAMDPESQTPTLILKCVHTVGSIFDDGALSQALLGPRLSDGWCLSLSGKTSFKRRHIIAVPGQDSAIAACAYTTDEDFI